ncbi:Site-specific integrase [Candidatus Hepatincolaceae symbiont of Richtersius coronifer]
MWNEVNFENKDIYIKTSKTGEAGSVPLSPIALKILLERSKLNLPKPFNRIIDFAKFKRTLAEASISKEFRWHDLRHTCASWLIKGWFSWQDDLMDIYRVSKWLRHSDVKMTQIYAHLTTEDLKNQINNAK